MTARSSWSARSRTRRTSARLFRRSSSRQARPRRRWLFAPSRSGASKRIDLRLGTRVVAVDRQARTATTGDGAELRWDALVLATGARVAATSVPCSARRSRPADRDRRARPARRAGSGNAPRHRRRRLRRRRGGVDRNRAGRLRDHDRRRPGAVRAHARPGDRPAARPPLPPARRRPAPGRRRRRVPHGPDGLTTVILSGGREVDCDIALVAIGCEPARELTPFEPEPPIYACGDVAGSRRPLDGGRVRGDRRRSEDPRARAAAGAAAVLLVGPVRPPAPTRRRARRGRPSRDGGRSRTSSSRGTSARDGELLAALAANRPAEVGQLRRELAIAA